MADASDLIGPNAAGCMLNRWRKFSPQSPLMGVNLDEGDLSLDSSIFNCCGGTGLFAHKGRQASERCELTARWSRTSSLIYQIQKKARLPLGQLIQVLSENWYLPYGELTPMFQNKMGAAWRRSTKMPVRAWQYALMATWYFGAEGRIITLEDSVKKGTFGFGSEWAENLGARRFILIEGVSNLWDPLYSQMFEELLILCEAQGFIALVEIKPDKGKPRAKTMNAGGMTARVSKMRANAQNKFMSNRARGLLGRLCQWKEEEFAASFAKDDDAPLDEGAKGRDLASIDLGF